MTPAVASDTPLLQMTRIDKAYPGVQALRQAAGIYEYQRGTVFKGELCQGCINFSPRFGRQNGFQW